MKRKMRLQEGRLKLRVFVVLVTLFLSSLFAAAQIDAGSIVGTVTDQTEAVLVGATITVTNQKTGVAVTATTNNDGQYQVTALIPGTYSVKVTATDMAAQAYNGVEIHVQSRPALNFRLSVGKINNVVTVSSAAALLQTQSAELGGVVNTNTINDLPLNGRVYAQLALLVPGVGKYYSGPNETADRFTVNGNSELQNYFALDGIDNNSGSTNLQENTVQAVQPPPDALQEFMVQTRTYSAEFGTAAGGVINVSTKSGTNQFHGDVWEFLRNDKLDANNYFNNLNGVKRGHFTQNQYGGTVGGPILRNRTFFFADFQGFSSRTATTENSTVPTPLMKQGNFTELPFALNAVVPSQSGCIVANIVQPNCMDPVGRKLLSVYPNPNIPSAVANQGIVGGFAGGSNYQYQLSVPNDTYSGDIRIDHTLNEKNKIFGRYSTYRVDTQDPQWTSNPLAGASNFASDSIIHGNSADLSWTDTLSPRLLNEARFGFNRIYAFKNPPGSLPLGVSAAPSFGLTGVPVSQFTYGLPPISIGSMQSIGASSWRPQEQASQVWQFLDDVSWLKGQHSLKFGYQYYRSTNNFLDIQSPQGAMGAGGIYTNNHGFGVADLLLGDMSLASYNTPLVPHNFRPGHSFYAQDTWRATDKLTVDYGLRYELFAPLLNRDNEVANFTPANGGSLITAAPNASSWYGRSLINPDFRNFAPRFGLAYNPLNRLVFRGGYGIFYQHANRFGSEAVMNLNPPFDLSPQLSQQQGSTTPEFLLSDGFPFSELSGTQVPLSSLQIRAQDPNQRTSYVEQASFGTQYELSSNTVFSADYVGNFGHHMSRLRNANQGLITGFDSSGNPTVTFPYANLNNLATGQHAFLEYETNDGNTSYNGLQVALNRRPQRGLSYGLSYTWSHNIADFNVPINGNYTPQNAYDMAAERSDSTLDVRQRLVGNVTWALPIGQGGMLLTNDGWADQIIGGWQVNAIVTLQTGSPFTISAPDVSSTGGNHDSRANCIGDPFAGASSDPSSYVSNGTGFFINPAAFSAPTTGHFGTCRPYSVHGPGYEDVDLSLFKSFRVTESKRLEFRTEFFNSFNHPNFAAPSSNIAFPSSFGKVYGTVGDPREIQFALKFYY
ncbi:MAG: TonB-dependent receptor [Candidatus Acidoferrum typicum]|nr:TonB-dependent receptor [Candidatus Acidoferrum typicum]